MSGCVHGRGPIGPVVAPPVDLLVCFAVKEEAKYFSACAKPPPGQSRMSLCQTWLTGMGRKNAAESIRAAIAQSRPERVITAGFAGGLNPNYPCGAVLYDEDYDAGFGPRLDALGAIPARFYCHKRVATTAAEKAELWRLSGADAIEMESSVIRTICRESKIPCATVRVISDDARQDLPLDFNALMTSDDRIDMLRLIWTLARHPGRLPALIEFQRQTLSAARQLGSALDALT
jgi:adenosylhomocysteine nucleosidase